MALRIEADLDPLNQDWVRLLHEPEALPDEPEALPDSERQPVAWYLDNEGNRRPIYRRDGGVSTTGV